MTLELTLGFTVSLSYRLSYLQTIVICLLVNLSFLLKLTGLTVL